MSNKREGKSREYNFADVADVREWCSGFSGKFPTRCATVSGGAMAINGYGASVMFAPRLEGDAAYVLPPGESAPAYLVAEYENCPTGWRKQADAFFVPVPLDGNGRGPGMWYNWTMNNRHTHDIAVVPSTTGLNPITGQKADALRLERYVEKCPVHNIDFEGERFCPQCCDGKGLKWPPQNYVAAPNVLWWDGFRRSDGTVRQFWFSDDVLHRDVGVAVLGKDRVPAFGFAFFRSIQAKPPRSSAPVFYGVAACAAAGGVSMNKVGGFTGLDDENESKIHLGTMGGGGMMRGGIDGPKPLSLAAPVRRIAGVRRAAVERTVAVGAGSVIMQDLIIDPKSLSEWQPDPAAVITVYFVPEDVALQILEGPKRDLVGEEEGFLAGTGVQLGTE